MGRALCGASYSSQIVGAEHHINAGRHEGWQAAGQPIAFDLAYNNNQQSNLAKNFVFVYIISRLPHSLI